jgi:uncharacterized LabA/DUF88 family protein
MGNVAVYWDFENMHASLCDIRLGKGWYRNNRFQNQSAILDINPVMDYVATLGNININKAYGNWCFFHAYHYQLQNHSVDLLQLFHRGAHSKNGADIRLAIDIIEDLAQNPHISIVVVVGGDSDYISIAQKVRQKGRRIVGIGVQESTNPYWIRSCNEFKFYASLLMKAFSAPEEQLPEVESETMEEAKALLCKAVASLSSQVGGAPVLRAVIKPMMTRLDSSFDEANLGHKTFTGFLNACLDVISITQGKHDVLVELKASASPSCQLKNSPLSGPYHSILWNHKFDLVPPDILAEAASEATAIFKDNGGKMPSYIALRQELERRLQVNNVPDHVGSARKTKNLMYESRALKRDYDGKIGLDNSIRGAADLLKCIRRAIVKCIMDNIQDEPDVDEIAAILFGCESYVEEARALVREYAENEKSADEGEAAAV